MAKKDQETPTNEPKTKSRKATTIEGRESQLVSLAMDLAEKQLIEGTAKSQVITHFIKLGTIRSQIELEKLRRENELLEAKTENLKSAKRTEELYAEAMEAMKMYQGDFSNSVEDDYYDNY